MSIDQKFISAIKEGNVVAFPTETVYGLGADATNPEAIAKVFEIKGRPSDNPLIVHISDRNQVYSLAKEVSDYTKMLMDHFWPGPLTFVLKKKNAVLDAVTAGLNTVAIRMPDHELALELISKTGPLVAPSANKSGTPSPTKASHVKADFGSSVLVLDGGSTEVGIESTVLDVTGKYPVILRPGSIGNKEIKTVCKTVVLTDQTGSSTPKSPGQKYSHYKPQAEVRWLKSEDDFDDASSLFLMINMESDSVFKNIIHFEGDFNRLARELYDRFRQADSQDFKRVIIEPFDERYENQVIPALLNRIEKAIGS